MRRAAAIAGTSGMLVAALCVAQEQGPTPHSDNQLIIIPVGTHIPLSLIVPIHIKTAHRGDEAHFETREPVTVDTQVATPAGTYVEGVIDKVNKHDSASPIAGLQIRFTRLILSNHYEVDLDAAIFQAKLAMPEVMATDALLERSDAFQSSVGTMSLPYPQIALDTPPHPPKKPKPPHPPKPPQAPPPPTPTPPLLHPRRHHRPVQLRRLHQYQLLCHHLVQRLHRLPRPHQLRLLRHRAQARGSPLELGWEASEPPSQESCLPITVLTESSNTALSLIWSCKSRSRSTDEKSDQQYRVNSSGLLACDAMLTWAAPCTPITGIAVVGRATAATASSPSMPEATLRSQQQLRNKVQRTENFNSMRGLRDARTPHRIRWVRSGR
jgi:hypothetical protein